ncbi:MAG: hypothetical protein AAFR16_12900 [Pseudomonadota bacterium]
MRALRRLIEHLRAATAYNRGDHETALTALRAVDAASKEVIRLLDRLIAKADAFWRAKNAA